MADIFGQNGLSKGPENFVHKENFIESFIFQKIELWLAKMEKWKPSKNSENRLEKFFRTPSNSSKKFLQNLVRYLLVTFFLFTFRNFIKTDMSQTCQYWCPKCVWVTFPIRTWCHVDPVLLRAWCRDGPVHVRTWCRDDPVHLPPKQTPNKNQKYKCGQCAFLENWKTLPNAMVHFEQNHRIKQQFFNINVLLFQNINSNVCEKNKCLIKKLEKFVKVEKMFLVKKFPSKFFNFTRYG